MENSQSRQTNPWIDLWIYPRSTFRHILETNLYQYIFWLALFGGVLSGLNFLAYAWTHYPLHTHQPISALALSITIGALLGLINLYVGGWLFRLTGSWVGGKGTFAQVKCAVGWSSYPYMFSTLFSLFSYFSLNHLWVALSFGILNVVFLIWGFIIFLKILAEAHQFSIWRALGALLLAMVLLFVVFMIIALIIPLVQPLFAK